MNIPDYIRVLLVVIVAAMAVLALFYLRGKHLPIVQACAWGLLAVAVPVLGPFLVICLRPRRQGYARRSAALRRAHPRGLGRVI